MRMSVRCVCCFFLVVVAACVKPPLTTSTSTVEHDSTWINVQLRKQAILLPGDSVNLYTHIICVDGKPVDVEAKAKGKRIEAEATLKNGQLKVTCKEDSLKKEITIRDSTINILKAKTTTTTIVKTVYKTRDIDIACRTVCIVLIIALAVFILHKFKIISL